MSDFRLLPLDQVSFQDLFVVLSNPRISRHLPLFDSNIDIEWTKSWVETKLSLWEDKRLGPYAVIHNNVVAGWAGYQPDNEFAELAIVLRPESWGIGAAVIDEVNRLWQLFGDDRKRVFYLPRSRNSEFITRRLGVQQIGTTMISGIEFNIFKFQH
jgi:hypothetical protein